MKQKRLTIVLGVSLIVLLLLAGVAAARSQEQGPQPPTVIYDGVSTAVQFDVSPPLRAIRPLAVSESDLGREIPEGRFDVVRPAGPHTPDAALQSTIGTGLMPTPLVSFDGPSNLAGVSPPDPVGDVGPNHYVAMSNLYFQIFNKTGTSLYGPAANNTLWSGFGGACETDNAGDPVVVYDQLADRWLLTQFSDSSAPYYNCVALSTTADPLGTYYRWAFEAPEFPDYPKYGVWPDAYYISTRETTIGAYALNRAQMLAGNAAPQVVSFHVTQNYSAGNGLLPSDIDGSQLPPAGSPNFFAGTMDDGGGLGAPQDAINLWKFHVDWATPSNSTFTLANTIPVAAFDSTFPCSPGSRDCIPQPNTTNKIDILSYRQRPLWRLAYRNFGDHESLVTNQSVEAATNMAGIRWYEIRNPNGTPTIYQQGTYAPGVSDTIHRWMGSIAMDSAGNMALGYSASNGTTTYPSVWYTGRLATDPLNTLSQGEGSIVNGTGSQTGSQRWGDYTSMNVDPVDDCTFWYVNEYVPTTSSVGWRLRIGAFKFAQCGTPDFFLNTTPVTQTLCAPTSAVYSVTVGSIASFNTPVTLSAASQPAGTTANFSVNPVTPAGNSALTIGGLGAATFGNYTIDVVGVAATRTHTSTVGLNLYTAVPGAPALATPVNGAINVWTQPTLTWAASSQAVSYTLQIATTANFTNIITTVTGLTGTSYSGIALNTNTQYYWRVTAHNLCGPSASSTVFSFTTRPGPGECATGTMPNILYRTDFEAGASGWTHNAGAGLDTWVLTNTNTHSGNQVWHADDLAAVSDQRLVSPAVLLPIGQDPVVLEFWNWQHMETRSSGGCFDGGLLEVTANGGLTWTQVITPNLLTDPYDGPIAATFSNPLAGLNAWCGNNPQAYLNSIADVSAYAGQTVQFRFRLGTDSSASRPGWNIDDVAVQSCQAVNVPPEFVSVQVVPATVYENDVITLTGTFTDPDVLDTHGVEVNWADGTLTETLPTLGAGVTAFTATHQYLNGGSPASLKTINLTLHDDHAHTVVTTTNVAVNNALPTLSNVQVTSPIDENGIATLTGNLADAGTQDTFTLTVAWGEGNPIAYPYPAGTTAFTQTHQYLDDDPSGTISDNYTVGLTLTDNDLGSTLMTTSLTIDNVAPLVEVEPIGAVRPHVALQFTGAYTDSGTLDTHTLTWDFGDGITTTASLTPTHTYTTTGTYTATLTVTDDDDGVGSDALVIKVMPWDLYLPIVLKLN